MAGMKALIIGERFQEIVDPAHFKILYEDMKLVDIPPGAKPGWIYRNGQFKAPTPSGAADQLPDTYKNAQIAKRDMILSDQVMVRVFESGITKPQDWIDYRKVLRQIIALEHDAQATPIPIPEAPPLPPDLV